MKFPLPVGISELIDLLRPAWPEMSEGLRVRGELVCEGDSDPDPDPAKGDSDPDPDPKPAAEKTAEEWRKELRTFERNAKRGSQKDKDTIAELQEKLQEREDADKSEQEKAVDAARKEGETAAEAKYREQRRADQLELAVTRQSTRGVKLEVDEDGKTVEKTVKFADPDDALVHLERAIKRGEVDGDDIFDENGKVQKDALETALAELLEEKPHLAARETAATSGAAPKPKGDADGGKGTSAASDEMSVADIVKAKQLPSR